MPLIPGTEHINLALRNVVHLFTRLLCPPISFWNDINSSSVGRTCAIFYNSILWLLCICTVTLHSCPILAMVAFPVCSPSIAFSLKNRKILSSSGLSLSGIKWTLMNLGSRGKHKQSINVKVTLQLNLCPNNKPFTRSTPLKPILHDILQSWLSNNNHSLHTPVLQYLTLRPTSAPSPNPT